ncbi:MULTISPECIES: hypothetical protein [unclassified Colwellia]|uniref:hypothetical protein n=1 Tax=unclassified Colwellia TaxID=196834 RepID=UPI0015F746C6|nr:MULTISPECIES: hypothetical protein [unclassified Colwellia]MBA6377602.1 hypothetical protein [Colwellia sp. BRX10-7]MBA6386474.1 hypothetical protein [Colwellia sp. BRX10-2]MBA6401742.1 hypothetical protein [Colwellia sp. BRX10-5]MBA6404234.1 hypothetical protein [Colwellia sp. BRX10-1]
MNKKYFNSKLLLLIMLGIIVLSFFLITSEQDKNVDSQVSQSVLPTSKKLAQPTQHPAERIVKNTGKILSIHKGGGYSFIEVELPSRKILTLATANLPNKLLVGNAVLWENPRLAKNYFSHALNKSFERLYMVTIKDDSIKTGVITAIKTVNENTFLSIQQDQSILELIVKSGRVSDELLVGNKIEWQQEKISPNRNNQPPKMHTPPRSPVMVDWIKKSEK